jgi:hypothetical protein
MTALGVEETHRDRVDQSWLKMPPNCSSLGSPKKIPGRLHRVDSPIPLQEDLRCQLVIVFAARAGGLTRKLFAVLGIKLWANRLGSASCQQLRIIPLEGHARSVPAELCGPCRGSGLAGGRIEAGPIAALVFARESGAEKLRAHQQLSWRANREWLPRATEPIFNPVALAAG